ncbi:TMEM251 [Bugula neritina]|uniref:Lysosomal enzyme trafficking factor n=1 Tax=Bugula neritina TaxID=10212 RepID=A0A7J7KIT2_BUGNE|nr:TMEM251 [Bugula neritina]
MPGLCGDMKFRQRVAWLGVLLYIAATAFFFYYLFEISDTFNAYALDHIHHYHTKGSNSQSKDGDTKEDHKVVLHTFSHVLDIPKPLIITVTTLLYLQIFFTLLACTKQEPRFSIAYAWPAYLYAKLCHRQSAAPSSSNTTPSKLEQAVTAAA